MIRIDKNIKSFVIKLNRIKGVYPASSCGGHKDPKGSRQPDGVFFVIMNIWNPDFLIKFNNLCNEYNEFCSFEYSELHETWCVNGVVDLVDMVMEEFIDDYIAVKENIKPEPEWAVFYSYDVCPQNTTGMCNSYCLARFVESITARN